MRKQQLLSYTPEQAATSSNPTNLSNCDKGNVRNGMHQTNTHSKFHPKETIMEKKENLAIESFWEKALKADSLLLWIVVNSDLALEGYL